MLKTDFQNDIQLHAVPLSRIKQFRDASQAEPMRTIIIKLDTRTVGSKVMKEIREMILGYGRDLTYLYAEPMRTIIIKLDTRTVGSKVMKEIREMILGYGRDLTYLYDLLARREYRRYCAGQKFIQLRRRLRVAFRAEQKQNPNLKSIS